MFAFRSPAPLTTGGNMLLAERLIVAPRFNVPDRVAEIVDSEVVPLPTLRPRSEGAEMPGKDL